MGGIFGTLGLCGRQGPVLLKAMADGMSHRGNDTRYVSIAPFSGGVVRHSWETDTKVVTSNDNNIVALCEGEVYNFKELADYCELEVKGSRPSGFDPIPRLYKRHGKDFARYVNGAFAIALYDSKENLLLLVRDHVGSHSIFYSTLKDLVLFGSTATSLFNTGLVDKNIDRLSLDRYLASLAISPPYTMFNTVKAVRPGHTVVIKGAYVSEYSYWPLSDIQENYAVPEDQFVDELREIFKDAVRVRANHGGSIGLLVSGGVDTSSIAAVLSENTHKNSVMGFSVTFDERQFSDARLQDIVYSRFAIEANRIVLKPQEFADSLITGIRFLDSPVNDVAFAGMYQAFRAASEKQCRAVFEGEGSDEIFCTNHTYGEFDIQPYLVLPYVLRRALFGAFKNLFSEKADIVSKGLRYLARIGMSDLERRSTWIPGFPWQARRKLLGISCKSDVTWEVAKEYYQHTKLRDAINIYQYGLARLFLPDDLLFKNERMASAVGVINRTPFVDYRLVEKAFQIPARYKIQPPSDKGDGTKLIFKKAMRGIVPDEILDRKKTRGFSQPTAVWFRNELRDFVYDNIFNGNAKIFDWLDKKAVQEVYGRFINGKVVSDYYVNALLILELWMQYYL